MSLIIVLVFLMWLKAAERYHRRPYRESLFADSPYRSSAVIFIRRVDAVWKHLHAQTHSVPATEELFDREITAFLAVRDPVGGLWGSRH